MKNTNRFEAHALLGELPNALRELWIEIPGDCHLNCSYCLAFENKKDFKFINRQRIDNRNNLLDINDYLNILKDFRDNFPLSDDEKTRDVKKLVAIPAAGEPFFTERMRNYIYSIIDFCERNDMIITIFTTGDLISEADIERLKPFKNIRLIVKFNSFDELIQDKIVGRKNYTLARGRVIEKLITEGFNDGRLGIVTSLIKQNVNESEKILRFARENNLTFDMDLIISRGKGQDCHCQFNSNNELLEAVENLSLIDEKEYGRHWLASPTYIGSKPCTRFSYHLYIQNNGDVSPCIGSTQIIYGNIKSNSLEEIWNSKLSQVVRNRVSNIKGECASCKNFGTSCFSCLSRSAINLPESLDKGYLQTVGCNIFGPIKH
jgi:MoaA/NifB/PqqE/SkfB family radical SAM enzyme